MPAKPTLQMRLMRWMLVGLVGLLLCASAAMLAARKSAMVDGWLRNASIYLRSGALSYRPWDGGQGPEAPPQEPIRHPKGFGISIPEGPRVHGIDVSKYQRGIQWEEVADMYHDGRRIQFAFIKATEGWWTEDRNFRQNWAGAREAGIIRGAYHFYRPGADPELQARAFLTTVELDSGDLPPVLDAEQSAGARPAQLREEIGIWLQKVEEATGIRPIIYTNRSYYLQFLHGYFDEYPLWVAQYHKPSCNVCEGREWTFWQHSDRGRVNGIAGPVDFNVFSGSMAELKALCIRHKPN